MSGAGSHGTGSPSGEGGEGPGKDDENLVQNWSLTFTEYANQNRYIEADGRIDEPDGKTIAGKGTARQTSDGDKDNISANDEAPVPRSDSGADKEDDTTIRDEQLNEIDKQGKGNLLNRERCVNGALTSSAGNAERLKSGGLKRDGNNNNASRNGEFSFQNGNKESDIRIQDTDTIRNKNTVLPPINWEKSEKDRTRAPTPQHEKSKLSNALSAGIGSGSKPPRNTPAQMSEYGGKVQPIYVRMPGQRHGQMMFAEMNHQAGKVRIVSRDKEKEMLARLSWLLLDAGTAALKATFDSIHPPVTLSEHLGQPHVRAVLNRLLQQSVLTDRQWKLLYPQKKRAVSSQRFDSRTLVILLETVCHLCPPYPYGWSHEPLPKDGSLSADIVRLQLLYLDIARHDSIAGEIYGSLFIQIRDVIVRLGGPPMRIKISRIESELINLELQQHYIQVLREAWQPDILKKLERIHEPKSKTSKTRKTYADAKGNEEGLSPEDRVTLKRTTRVLVDRVLAEDVLDRLQQSQVIKFSQRQQVLAVTRRSDRMQSLLDIIMDSKLPYALKALFDGIKFKYKKIYEEVMAVRKQTYKEGVVMTVDVEGITRDALCVTYRNMFSRICPFPWDDSIHGTIRDVYTSLDIVNMEGRKLNSSELLPALSNADHGNRILLEGGSGSGKTYFCAWLAYMWAIQPHFFRQKYEQLLYLDMNELSGNFENAVYHYLFSDNFKISASDFWKMISRRARDVLIVIDGYDESPNVDISDILSGAKLAECTVLLAADPHKHVNFTPDTRWFIAGLSVSNIKRCFKNCVNLSNEDHEQFEKLYHLAGRESWLLRPHLSNPMLAVKAFATFSILRKGTMLKEMRTVCDLLDKYGTAMAMLYCKKRKIDVEGFDFPDEVLETIKRLESYAHLCVMNRTVQFTAKEVEKVTEDPEVFHYGAFTRFRPKSKLKFASGLTKDFLASRFLADMVYEDIENTILRNKMVKMPHFIQFMSFLIGQYRQDKETPILQTLFDQLAARNDYCVRGNHLPAPSIASTADDDVKIKVPRGVLQDFITSLQCLAECPLREDMASVIAQSLPQRLIMKREVLLQLKTVQGLTLCLGHEQCSVTELDMEFHSLHSYQTAHFLEIAKVCGHNRHIRSVKITWSSLDIMSRFLATILEDNHTIDTIVLIEDLKRKPVRQVSAATWEALQNACHRMTSVERFSFLSGRVTSIVNHVLQHIPDTLSYVNMTGCAMNQMCAGQIACFLHGNTNIRVVDLSYIKMLSTEFVVIFQGMQMCNGIQHIRLRGARLERPCVVALTEYIRLTNTLEVLDLSDCELSTDLCTRLVSAIKQNRTISKLVFKNAKITVEGRQVIAKTTSKIQPVLLEGLVPLS